MCIRPISSILLALALLVVSLSGAPRAQAVARLQSAANLLANGDFEAQWRGWGFHALGTGVGNMHAQAARSGSYGVLIRGGGAIRQTVTGLTPSTTYTLSGFARSTRASSPTLLQISDYGGATVAHSTGGQGWETLRLTFTTGPQASSAVISVVAPQSDDRIHYADDLRLALADEAVPGSAAHAGRQYEPLELALQATRPTANPYRDVQLSATFSGPDGQRISIAGFWDGGDTWRVRFTPTAPGVWSYQTGSEPADPGLSQSGTISVAKAASDSHGFLRVDGRHFAFDDGAPFFMLGTTAYTLARTALGGGDYRAFLDGSAAHGITKVRTLVYPWDSQTPFPYRSPFVGDDHDRPDLPYWQALDQVVSAAAARSLLVDLILFADSDHAFGSLAQDQRYVRTILARYAAFPNVIWTLTNEWEATGKPMSYWNTIGALVQKEDPYGTNTEGLRRALSIHNQTGGAGGGRFAFAGQAWPTHAVVQYGVRNGSTTFGDVWAQQSILRNTAPGWPVVNDEISYLGEQATN
ncbi:MAG: DUF5060 domain-containing protein, partial [Chloroflexales bacterium]|nr:DUF5060 domain-containing protein [Chloroflexales bacterium]